MTATFYGIPGSHAVMAGALMLEHKGVPYQRVDFPSGTHRVLVRLRGFPGDRVPAVLFDDGRRAQGTREIPRVLDELKPAPRLVPDDPPGLEAERWADDVLQQWARRMTAWTGARDPGALVRAGAEGRLGKLLASRPRQRRLVCRVVLVAFDVTEERIREDKERTGEILDQVDAWIGEGVLNGQELRSPDFAVATSLALVEYIVELRPELQRRPLGALMDRVFSRSAAARGPG